MRSLFENLYERALKRLARRDRSLAEMRSFLLQPSRGRPGEDELTQEGFSQQIDEVLRVLVERRYLDEDRLAEALIRDQRLQSRGPRSAWMKLKKRGIEGWTLDRVEQVWRTVESAHSFSADDGPRESSDSRSDQDEVETARRWVLRRYRGLQGATGTELQRERQRALGALVRRGFSLQTARKVLQF